MNRIIRLSTLINNASPTTIDKTLLRSSNITTTITSERRNTTSTIILLISLLRNRRSRLSSHNNNLKVNTTVMVNNHKIHRLVISNNFNSSNIMRRSRLLPVLTNRNSNLTGITIPLITIRNLRTGKDRLTHQRSQPNQYAQQCSVPCAYFSVCQRRQPYSKW